MIAVASRCGVDHGHGSAVRQGSQDRQRAQGDTNMGIEMKHALATQKDNIVRVSVPAEILFDFKKFAGIQKDILGRLGCAACTSGHDIRWDITRNFVVDIKGQIHESAPRGW
jgi:hypothetical protein